MPSDFRSKAYRTAGKLREGVDVGNKAGIDGWSAALEGYLAAADGTGQMDTLERLSLAASVDQAVEREVHHLVEQARTEGRSWREIGEALGVATQSAWERFSGEG